MKYKVPITVIMPCYNSEEFISQAIESILNQSYGLFEFIIINDGSKDNTEKEIKKFKDSRIRYLSNSKNSGECISRNLGMSIANGKYIAMMDADDLAPLDRLELQYNFLESHPHVGALGGSFEVIDRKNKVTDIANRPTKYAKIKAFLLMNNYIAHPTLMTRSHLIRKYQLFYSKTNWYAGDYDLIVRASQLFPIRNLENILLRRRMHPMQMTAVTRMEQKACAGTVRELQLKKLGISFTDEDLILNQKLMEEEYIEEGQLKKCEDWLNKIYEANKKKKLYNDKYLFELLEYILKLTVYNSYHKKE